MSSPSRSEVRRRLVTPVATMVVVVAVTCGLVGLRLGACGLGAELPEPGRDPLTEPYLRAIVAGHPDDAAMRVRLVREQLALGKLADAEQTLAPLLGERPAPAVAELSLELALTAWRAARDGTPARASAATRLIARVEQQSGPGATLDDLTRATLAAREVGRPELAARAEERAAALDHRRCSAWLVRAASDFLAAGDTASAAASRLRAYECGGDGPAARALALAALDLHVAADRGGDALRFADQLVARFPDDREIVERAETLALANGDPAGARRFASRLLELGAADQTVLARLFDLDLAAGDLPGALRIAEQRVGLAPRDPRFRRLVARVAEWAGRPELGLAQWSWLAQRGDAAGLEHGLRLAHALDDDAALAELLTQKARRAPLAGAQLLELAGAFERLGSPERSAALLEDAARRSASGDADAAWEQLAAFHERRRDLGAALAALARQRGVSLSRSLRLARLAWAAGRPGAALDELGRWSASAGGGETEYWRLLAELAWEQESDDLARLAYRALWQADQIDALGAERLVLLSRDAGRPADAIRYGRDGWERLGEPRLLLLAMDEAARTRRWDELARLRQRAARDEDRFAGFLAYWLLCAQLDGRAGRVADAAQALRRALAIDGGSAAARSGMIWLRLDSGDRDGLARALATWAADADDDPGLWRAYAAGLERLGRVGEALTFYRREAEAAGADGDARDRYAAARRRAAASAATPAAPSPTVVTAELGVTTLGSVTLSRLGAAARTELRTVDLELRSTITRVSDTARVPALERDAIDLLAGAALPALGGRAELLAGASVQRDGAVPRAQIAYTRQVAPRAQLRAEAAVNDLAPESAILLAQAVRTRAGGSLALGTDRFYGRATGEIRTWSTRAGDWIGRGAAGTIELGIHARRADPELNARLQGGYQRNEVAQAMPDAPLLPDELASIGVGAGLPSWTIGGVRLLLDAWLGWMTPPRRPAYRLQGGVAIEPFTGAELSLVGYGANDSWMIGRGELGVTAALAYRFPSPRS